MDLKNSISVKFDFSMRRRRSEDWENHTDRFVLHGKQAGGRSDHKLGAVSSSNIDGPVGGGGGGG
jgi:hypothetical protein